MNVIYCHASHWQSSQSSWSWRIPFKRFGYSEKAERFNIPAFPGAAVPRRDAPSAAVKLHVRLAVMKVARERRRWCRGAAGALSEGEGRLFAAAVRVNSVDIG